MTDWGPWVAGGSAIAGVVGTVWVAMIGVRGQAQRVRSEGISELAVGAQQQTMALVDDLREIVDSLRTSNAEKDKMLDQFRSDRWNFETIRATVQTIREKVEADSSRNIADHDAILGRLDRMDERLHLLESPPKDFDGR